MKILLTNDDSIYAEGIYAMYQALLPLGKVTVVAPDSQKSSVGHGITLSHPIWYKKVNRRGKFFGYGISGTPADCVKFAKSVILKSKPDVVVSGINLGQNDGCSVFYSGTVAGAREGALLGIPSIAISLATFVNPAYEGAALIGAKIIKNLAQYQLPRGTFLNVNVPNVTKFKGVRVTQQGTVPIHGAFRKRFDPSLREYYWMTGRMPAKNRNLNIDTQALNENYVTVTPIQSDSTNHTILNHLKSWNF